MAPTVVPESLCASPMNWNMCATEYGEIHVPFFLHVRLAATATIQAASKFLLFSQLPRELQLYILQFCDSATLFQLMQVSSSTRKEAQKLFWSQPDVWYLINGDWLLLGGLMGYTYDAADALGFMQRVEIDIGCKEPFPQIDGEHEEDTSLFTCADGDYTEQNRTWQIQKFWQVLQHHLPQATHVVLTEDFARFPGTPLPSGLRRIAEQCPPGIHAYVSFLQKEAGHNMRLTRRLWRPVYYSGGTNASWEVVYPTWTRRTVLPPPKEFRGPVGVYCHLDYRRIHQLSLKLARRLLLLQAVETYYTENRCPSFICPSTRCQQQFEVPYEWVLHAIDASHYKDIMPPGKQFQILFDQHDARFVQMEQQNEVMLSSMRVAWGDEGSQKRKEAKNAFLYQLEHDPLYAQLEPARQRLIWYDYQHEMDNEYIIR